MTTTGTQERQPRPSEGFAAKLGLPARELTAVDVADFKAWMRAGDNAQAALDAEQTPPPAPAGR
ncbi:MULTISPECIES: hypothetical protein [Actinoplanes]|uniref:hypothetical protein n=1 Tax=Actinoplanes TaxID=1865 RepID=UPI0012F815F0|nr:MULTISPECIES: hypothetical protein [Actinoplanes]